MLPERRLRETLSEQAKRLRKAETERDSLLMQTAFAGTLGLLLALPIVAGAYLGHWLDSLADGYSVRWTLGCILLGIALGIVNVWLFIKERT